MKVKEICQDCGKVFLGGSKAFLCPKCRKRRVEEGKKKARESRAYIKSINCGADAKGGDAE